MTSIRTGKTSILKNFESRSRDLVKNSITNRVRFELITHKRLHEILLNVEANAADSVRDYNQYLSMIRDEHISESDFLAAIQESKECVELLIKYEELAKALMKLDWARHNADAVKEYQSFLIDLLSSHNKFVKTAINNMVSILVPRSKDEDVWTEGKPSKVEEERIRCVLDSLRDILEIIPLSVNILLEACQECFPFYSSKPFIYVGYFRNMLEVMKLSPSIQKEMLARIVPKLILLDANTPRQDIDDAENSDSDSDSDDNDEMFEMEVDERKVKPERNEDEMKSPQAESLDLCMNQLFDFVQREHSKERTGPADSSMFQSLMEIFETYLLPAHNTHHVQFLLFYFCSFDPSFAESFTNTCWQKLNRLNCPNPIRQASVGYLASMLTRSMFITVDVLKDYLDDMCGWIRQYIQRCDSGQSAHSLKAHSVFYATCQAVFYVISFRSRDLTSSNKNLLFLQSLQLNTIVTCNLNPLRFCLPAVATAFSGVTRAHQLAYCHTVLERNARRKLATIYTNDLFAAEEVLETFFPFDQYMLKRSGRRIAGIYREYQSSEAEEEHVHAAEERQQKRRKCMESGSFVEDMEDFIMRDKRSKIVELSKSFDRDLQFHNMNHTK